MYSALYRSGETQFQTNFTQERDFHIWFEKSYDTQWAVLIKNSDGQVVCTCNKTAKQLTDPVRTEALKLSEEEVADLEQAIHLAINHLKISPAGQPSDELIIVRYRRLLTKTSQLHLDSHRTRSKVSLTI